MTSDYKMATILALVASMLLAVQVQSVLAQTYPNYRTDKQLHAVLTNGNKGTIAKSTSTLTDSINVLWAKSFSGEFILTWDSYSSSAVGSGWMHFKNNNNSIQNSMAVYYWDYPRGVSGLTFAGEESGTTFSALTLRGIYDSINSCWTWTRTVGTTYSEDKCLQSFQSGLGEIWSFSNSGSNTFSSSTEYTNLQYYPNSGGGLTSWSSAGGSIYCHNDSPFATNQVTNVNNWDVIPPGTGTSCTNDLTVSKPVPN